MEHQNWDYTVYSKGKGSEKGDKAVNKAMRDGKEVETLKKGCPNIKFHFFSRNFPEIFFKISIVFIIY